MAIDREQIVDAILYGYGEPGRATVPPSHFAYDPEARLPYSPAGAQKLLAEAGWRPGRDGVLVDAEGRPLRFTIITNAGNDFRRDIAEIVHEQLRRIGIVAQPRVVEWTTLVQQLQGTIDEKGVRSRNFDAVISGWTDWQRKDDAGLLHSRHLGGPYQYAGYTNPRIDSLLDSLGLTIDDEEAASLWIEYQRLLVEEAPYAVLYYPAKLIGIRARVRGARFDVRGDFATAQEWWIDSSDGGEGVLQ
jgi:peptide/nickel transport system substrate-binding protein